MSSVKKNYFYQIVYEILAIFLPLITAPYIARVLGAKNIGIYSYAFSIANLFLTVARLGIVNHGSRSIAACQNCMEKRSRVFWEIYAIQASAAVIVTLVYILYVVCFTKEDILIGLLLGLHVCASFFDIAWFHMGMENFRKTVTKNIVVKLVSLVCIFVFVRNQNDLWKYAIVASGSMLIGHLTLWIGMKNQIRFVKLTWSGILAQVKPVVVLFIPAIAVTIYTMMDKVMLGAMVNKTEVGYYEYASKLVAVPLGFITGFGSVMLPRMSAMASSGGDRHQQKQMTTNSLVFIIFIASSFTFGLSAISEHLIPVYYGNEFLACIPLLVLLASKLPALSWANVIRTQWLLPNHRDREYIISLFIGALTNLIMNVVLIPRFAANGAAIGTIVAEYAVCLSQSYFVRDHVNHRLPMVKSIGFLISGLLMFICVRLVSCLFGQPSVLAVVVEMCCGVIVYLTLSFFYYCLFIRKSSVKQVVDEIFRGAIKLLRKQEREAK